jgi:hypothetical protein
VGTSRHHATEAAFGSGAFGVDVDDALNLGMVEEKSVNRTISAIHKGLGEPANVETLDAVLAIVAAAEELDAGIGMVRVELSNFFVEALVKIVAVLVLQFPYFALSVYVLGFVLDLAAAHLLPGLYREVSYILPRLNRYSPLNLVTSFCNCATTLESSSMLPMFDNGLIIKVVISSPLQLATGILSFEDSVSTSMPGISRASKPCIQ